uniref:DHC_N1 domain-containing protein n=1 Tax=Schistocephalus solidus TaxID=70667 RepID=A0A183SCA9_SCHSO
LEDLHAPDDNATVETRWCQLRKVIQSTTLEVLRRARRQHQDWFEDNDSVISNLLAEKNGLHKAFMDLRTDPTKAAFFRCRSLVQQLLREIQDAWMIRKAEEIQGYADRNEMKFFFKAIKAIYGPCITGSAPLLSYAKPSRPSTARVSRGPHRCSALTKPSKPSTARVSRGPHRCSALTAKPSGPSTTRVSRGAHRCSALTAQYC